MLLEETERFLGFRYTSLASQSCNELFTGKFSTFFKLFQHRVNASSNFATVTFFIVFKMCRLRVNAVLVSFDSGRGVYLTSNSRRLHSFAPRKDQLFFYCMFSIWAIKDLFQHFTIPGAAPRGGLGVDMSTLLLRGSVF